MADGNPRIKGALEIANTVHKRHVNTTSDSIASVHASLKGGCVDGTKVTACVVDAAFNSVNSTRSSNVGFPVGGVVDACEFIRLCRLGVDELCGPDIASAHQGGDAVLEVASAVDIAGVVSIVDIRRFLYHLRKVDALSRSRASLNASLRCRSACKLQIASIIVLSTDDLERAYSCLVGLPIVCIVGAAQGCVLRCILLRCQPYIGISSLA